MSCRCGDQVEKKKSKHRGRRRRRKKLWGWCVGPFLDSRVWMVQSCRIFVIQY